MAKISVDLEGGPGSDGPSEKVRELAASLPSVSVARAGAFRDAPRVHLSFTNVPRPINDALDREADRSGMGKKEALYSCLRLGGIEIPDGIGDLRR